MDDTALDPKHTVSVRELNQNTSGVLVRVQAGEELLVNSNGQPIAKLLPVTPVELFLAKIVAEGRAIAPTESARFAIEPWKGGPDLDLAARLVADRADEERW